MQFNEGRCTLIAERCKARWPLDTSGHVHKHDKLGMCAYTRGPSMRACACIKWFQYMQMQRIKDNMTRTPRRYARVREYRRLTPSVLWFPFPGLGDCKISSLMVHCFQQWIKKILSLLYTQIPCRKIHVKHERANMDGDWDCTYEWNTVYLLCCTWPWSKLRWHMQIFKACTCSVNPCIWQAWYKARAHTPSHKQQGTCAQALKSFEGLRSVHESWDNSSKQKKICR
jgi:hypothetical protein